MANINKFVHFGCWNNLNKKGQLPKVMELLNNYLDERGDIQLVVVSGDNYYPDKKKMENDKKKKIIFANKLIQGFNLLPQNVEIDMILGNHDLENDPSNKELFVDEGSGEYPEGGVCKITELEKIASKQNSKINFNLFKHRMLGSDSLMILIDTSMYSTDSEVQEYLPCYNVFLEQTFDSVENLRNYQNQFIYDIVSSKPNIKNLIMIGHHPITGFKLKKERNKLMNDIPYFYEVLRNVYDLTSASGTKYYYLCADYHSYQNGTVFLDFKNGNEMEITQYISGTGGTELDDDLNYSDDTDEFENPVNVDANDNLSLNYKMVKNIRTNGFLECEINGENEFTCRLISTERTSGGRRRKTKKNKKYKYKKTRRRNRKSKRRN